MNLLSLGFSTGATSNTYHVRLASADVGEASGHFLSPYDAHTWPALQRALAPNFVLAETDAATRTVIETLGGMARLLETIGAALTQALWQDPALADALNSALGMALSQRQPLPIELRFGEQCDAVAALPWELLYHQGHFLVADGTVALARYPEGLLPPTIAQTELPLRVLLVLSEPLDAEPVFSAGARTALVHGLRTLDEIGAVIVDQLRPPTFATLIEAVSNGHYHWLIFYGPSVHDRGHDEQGGQLLFEDEYGAGQPVRASDLGAALRNTEIRLVLLGACDSAKVTSSLPLLQSGDGNGAPSPGTGEGWGGGIWRGTAAALIRAGVPLAIGMQTLMRVDAAQAFIRQFALSLAAGKAVIEALAEARKPLLTAQYGTSWFAPALYGRPLGAGGARYQLFEPALHLPAATIQWRGVMQEARATIAELERTIGSLGGLGQVQEIAQLRLARQALAAAHAQVARQTPGGYAPITSPLYGVPHNALFVGRSAELIRVGQALRQGPPVVIWGAGGLGKTALAAEVAHRQSWRYPGGVLWLNCQGAPALDTLLERLAAFCGLADLSQTPPDQKLATVRAALARLGQPCLLVWDNAEDVWGDVSIRHFVRDHLPAHCQVLLTTRDDPDEAMWPTIEVPPLRDAAMHRLFGELSATAGVKMGTPADEAVIEPMLAWLAGHPLAVTLIVPLAKRRGLRRIWADLQAHPLKGVEAAFAASYARLTAAQQQFFTRLSVFTIPFEFAAAEALLPAADEVDELLDGLVQRALIQFDGATYSYHALLRQYAYARLGEREDVHAVHQLAAEFLQALRTTRARTPDEVLEEVDQWAQAAAWSMFVQRASALVGSLDRLGYWGAIAQRLAQAQRVITTHLAADPPLQAQVWSDQATIAWKSAQWDDAIRLWQRSLQTYEQVGDSYGLARTYNNLGLVYKDKGEWDKAIDFYQRAVQTYEQVGDSHGLAQTYGNLGNVYADKREWDKAIDFYQRSLAITEQMGDWVTSANQYTNLGLLYLQTERAEEAKPLLARAYRIYTQVGSPNADIASDGLVKACGSVEAAEAYLAAMTTTNAENS